MPATQRPRQDASERSGRQQATGRRRTLLALLLMALGVLLAIAVLSHDPADEAGAGVRSDDLVKTMTGDPDARAKADITRNWLGLVGAIVSDALVNSTVGYSALALPVLLSLWGWIVLRRGDVLRGLTITVYMLVTVFLLASTVGMVRLFLAGDGPGKEWSGVVGDYLATVTSHLFGKAGASVLLVTLILVTLVFAADLDVRATAERLRSLWLRLLDWLERQRAAQARGREHPRGTETRARAAEGEEESAEEIDNGASRRPPVKTPVRIARPEEERPLPDERPVKSRTIQVAGAVGTVPPAGLRRVSGTSDAEADAASAAAPESIAYVFPPVDLLEPPAPGREDIDEEELKANADLLRDTLAEFDVDIESVSVTPGPVVTLYELVPASGVKISRIVSLENDMALKLAAKGIRILAPIPGKAAVGVEIPNQHRSLVTIRSVINAAVFRDTQAVLPLAMGKTISGEVFTDDLAKMPHLLIAGSTGSGKSVGINTILASLLYRKHPAELKFVIIDPKKIELSQYAKLRNHFLAVSPDMSEQIITTPQNAVLALKGVEYEMEKRYDKLSHAGTRNIEAYNEKVAAGTLKNTDTLIHTTMPYLVVVIDELADLMITAAREVEEPIARLAQLARAVGIHLIVATQRPSVDVITGVIKANFPARIAYQVASKTDSRTILDMNGAEQLLGNGDMLYLASGSPKPTRLQNAYISPDEVDRLMEHISTQQGFAQPFLLPSILEKRKAEGGGAGGERDELFEEAARLIVRHQQGSVSLLQRRLKVGYSRAARLVDELEAAGIVGPFDGSKAREVLIESEAELESILYGGETGQ